MYVCLYGMFVEVCEVEEDERTDDAKNLVHALACACVGLCVASKAAERGLDVLLGFGNTSTPLSTQSSCRHSASCATFMVSQQNLFALICGNACYCVRASKPAYICARAYI